MKKNLIYLIIFAVVGAVAYWLYSNDTGSSISKKALSNFAIEDTASVAKIKIIGLKGDELVLSRGEDGQWIVNNKWKAAMSPVNLLLETFKSVGVQSTVPVAEVPGVLRHMGSTQTTVKIYGSNDKWIKTWTIGGATKTSQGTYMILETPEDGVSTEPYIVEKRGFRGYLTSRFHTDKEEWRWKGVFIHPNLDIKSISLSDQRILKKAFIYLLMTSRPMISKYLTQIAIKLIFPLPYFNSTYWNMRSYTLSYLIHRF